MKYSRKKRKLIKSKIKGNRRKKISKKMKGGNMCKMMARFFSVNKPHAKRKSAKEPQLDSENSLTLFIDSHSDFTITIPDNYHETNAESNDYPIIRLLYLGEMDVCNITLDEYNKSMLEYLNNNKYIHLKDLNNIFADRKKSEQFINRIEKSMIYQLNLPEIQDPQNIIYNSEMINSFKKNPLKFNSITLQLNNKGETILKKNPSIQISRIFQFKAPFNTMKILNIKSNNTQLQQLVGLNLRIEKDKEHFITILVEENLNNNDDFNIILEILNKTQLSLKDILLFTTLLGLKNINIISTGCNKYTSSNNKTFDLTLITDVIHDDDQENIIFGGN